MDRAALAHLRHELRTPLNHIIGYGEMLVEDGGRPEMLPDLRYVLDEAAVVLGLVNDFLAPAAVEAGTVDLTRLPAELSPPLDRIIERSEALKKQALALGADEALADLDRIASGAEHLLALARGGLADRVAERTAAMPLADVAPAATAAATPTVARGVILVVDDNASNRDMLARRLGREGHEVHVAAGGNEALALLAARAVDLVLLDVMMPKMNGFDVCQALRADPELSAVRILMLTAKGRETEISKGLGLGADAYMTKPFSTKELVVQVRALLGL